MQNKTIILLFLSLFLNASGFTQDKISIDLSYQKVERSKDSNQKKYSFTLDKGNLNYIITERGRNVQDPVNGMEKLTEDQQVELSDFLSKNFKDDLKKNMSIDSYVGIISKGTVTIGKKSYSIDVSCGAEDNPKELDIVQALKTLLKSFIPDE